jgi:hypothetical protein
MMGHAERRSAEGPCAFRQPKETCIAVPSAFGPLTFRPCDPLIRALAPLPLSEINKKISKRMSSSAFVLSLLLGLLALATINAQAGYTTDNGLWRVYPPAPYTYSNPSELCFMWPHAST